VREVKLSKLVMEVSNTLVDLGMMPIRDIPQLPNMAQEVLAVADLILERLREEHASRTELWPAAVSVAPGRPACCFFPFPLFWNCCNVHTHRYIYIYIYIY
jgi:hypothetical protein